jgi:hypothetical protein
MKSRADSNVTKGMIFAGCSFTWGQGLYYYSNLSTVKEPSSNTYYDKGLIKPAHIKFKETVRFPRLVADHFNSYEFVHPENGGCNQGSVHWWKNAFKNPGARISNLPVPQIEYNEISYLIFQLTHWNRDVFQFKSDGDQIERQPFFLLENEKQYRDKFFKWLDSQQTSLDTCIENFIQSELDKVKQFLQECEEQGVKTLILTWPSEYPTYIEKDPWLRERFVTFDYNGKNYDHLEKLMNEERLNISQDFNFFIEPPKDGHPSLLCHKIIADSIIRFIESKEK